MNYVLWFFGILTVWIFWKFFLYPYLHNKYTYWKCGRILSKIANDVTDKETKDQLNEISDALKKAYKEEKMGDTLKEAIEEVFDKDDDDKNENKK